MYINNFSVRIVGGKEEHSGYVKMAHKQQYSIMMRNDWDMPAQAKVKVDGKDIGYFRIEAHDSINLQRPLNDDGHFTFFRTNSQEANLSGVRSISKADRGLVQVELIPELKVSYVCYHESDWWPKTDKVMWTYTNSWDNNSGGPVACYNLSSTLGEGMTGLSGKSDQRFVDAPMMTLDYSKRTVITLRLVENKDEPEIDARPVVSLGNLVPPPIG